MTDVLVVYICNTHGTPHIDKSLELIKEAFVSVIELPVSGLLYNDDEFRIGCNNPRMFISTMFLMRFISIYDLHDLRLTLEFASEETNAGTKGCKGSIGFEAVFRIQTNAI